MLLLLGETEIRREHAVPYRWGDGTGRGSVYLTNYRLVLESTPTRGLRSSAPTTLLDVSLRQVQNIGVGRVLRKVRYVQVETGAAPLRLDVVDPAAWVHAVAAARKGVPHPHAPPPVATHTIERQVVKLRCRYCGTLTDERNDRCPTCGAAL
jgi:hypothetical protein